MYICMYVLCVGLNMEVRGYPSEVIPSFFYEYAGVQITFCVLLEITFPSITIMLPMAS